jgi:hypothetical protein
MSDRRPPLPHVDLIGYFLRLIGWAAAALGVAAGLVMLALNVGPPAGDATFGYVLWAAFPMVLGAAAAAALHGLAALLELQYRAAHACRRMERAIDDLARARGPASAAATPGTAPPSPADDKAVLDAVAGLRDVLLMDEADRKARRQAMVDEDVRVRRVEIETAVGRKEFVEARKLAEMLAAKYPEIYDLQRLRDRVAAQEKNHRLQEADRLAEEAEKAARHEHWREAFALASRLVEQYADCPPADFARAGLDTLHRNAEIETRRELEDKFKDDLARGRFSAALATAETIVRDYPESPQAAALRDQLDRLREQAGRPD